MFVYFYCYVCSVLYILFSSCQLAFFGYPEVFPCLLLSCRANARVLLAKTGHGPHSSQILNYFVLYIILIVLFFVLFMCKCVQYYCHRVSTQLQLTSISYSQQNKNLVLRTGLIGI
jgi:hypothetical protein